MALSTEFTCPNGHTFKAVAKLRTRCPECGVSTKRNFSTTAIPTTSIGPGKPSDSSKDLSKPVAKKNISVRGSKQVTTSVAEEPSKSVTSDTPKLPQSPKKLRVVKMGNPRPKKPINKPTPTITRSVTQRKVAAVGSRPTLKTSLPKGSKERKVAENLGADEGPYWRKVQRKFGWNR